MRLRSTSVTDRHEGTAACGMRQLRPLLNFFIPERIFAYTASLFRLCPAWFSCRYGQERRVGESPLFICSKSPDASSATGTGTSLYMAVDLEQLRAAAQRVAASHGLDVVEVDFAGGGKFRALRVFLEKDAEGRARLADAARAAREAMAAGASKKRGSDEAGRLLCHSAIMSGEAAESNKDDDSGDDSVQALDEGLVPAAVLEGTLSIEHLSGVTHEDCEQFSRDFGMLLDVEDLVPGSEYTLEVSSPGLDRKLSSAAEYERFAGSLIKLQTFTPVAGNRHWKGRIVRLNEGKLVLDLAAVKQKSSRAKPGKTQKTPPASTVEIELPNVEKANLVPEF